MLPIALTLAALAACEPNQLYMATHAVVGVNAGVNPEQTTGSLLIGYDRTFATVIPRSVNTTGSSHEAMSALVCSELGIAGITIRRYTESLATGVAAKAFAKALASPEKTGAKVKDFFDCFTDRGTQNPTGANK
jgi:hypothetical protein